ncbi:MAG: SDR family NAD(P)-dependent oxidoreductase [Pseudomonadota bacterium]
MQSILITGANKGIGLAVVKAILREQPHYRVLLGSRDHGRGEAAVAKLMAETGSSADNVEAIPLDVTSEQSVAQAAARVQGELAGLVNNAGIASGSLADILNVNVYGMQRVSQHFSSLLEDGGRVVNVASASGPNYVSACSVEWQTFFQDDQLEWAELDELMRRCMNSSAAEMEQRGLPSSGYYGLSKASANLLSLITARENPRLLVNACTPGYIETDLTREMTGASGAAAAQMGMKQPDAGARVIMQLLFEPLEVSGHYFGSDGLRSPLDRYRSPGSPAYTGN